VIRVQIQNEDEDWQGRIWLEPERTGVYAKKGYSK
jgi:hypothetical protein